MDLVCRYSKDEYPTYDNYDAIDVSNTSDIPFDYEGIMGVPITFLDKYNPDQFEIVGAETNDFAESLGIKPIGKEWLEKYRSVGGTGHYTANMRNLVMTYKGKPKKAYFRILIRNKHPQTTI